MTKTLATKGTYLAGLLALSVVSLSSSAFASRPVHVTAPVTRPVAHVPVAWSLSPSQLRAESTALREGSWVNDRIRHAGDIVIYRLSTRSGQLSFRATGMGTDLQCELYDDSASSGPIVTSQGIGSRDCEIDVQIQSNRTYYVAVRGANRMATGDFRVKYDVRSSSLQEGTSRHRAIRLDRSRTQVGTLAPREERWYEVRLSNDVRFELEVESRNSLTCALLDERGNMITSNRAHGSRDCEIDETLASGTYYVTVKSDDSSRYLDYEIEYDTSSIRDDHSNSMSGATHLPRGRDVSGFLTRGDKDFFALGTLNGRVRIETASSSRTDTLCIVYDERGREVARDNDSGSNRQCRVDFHANGGRYFVEVRGSSYSSTGDYTIKFR